MRVTRLCARTIAVVVVAALVASGYANSGASLAERWKEHKESQAASVETPPRQPMPVSIQQTPQPTVIPITKPAFTPAVRVHDNGDVPVLQQAAQAASVSSPTKPADSPPKAIAEDDDAPELYGKTRSVSAAPLAIVQNRKQMRALEKAPQASIGPKRQGAGSAVRLPERYITYSTSSGSYRIPVYSSWTGYASQTTARYFDNWNKTTGSNTFWGGGASTVKRERELPALDMSKPVYVREYVKKDGTRVRAHTRNYPN